MKLGTGLFTCQQRAGRSRSMSQLYDDALELAKIADDAGLDSVWVSEHHFQPDGYMSGVMPALGALAAVTEDIEIGPCVALAPLYDSVRLAEDVATIDQLSDGRTTLGLSIGSDVREYESFGIPEGERVERLADAVSVLRGAWSDGPLSYEPTFHDVAPETTVTPSPAHDVPIVLGGSAKPAVRRAARLADAWCAPSGLSLDALETRVADIKQVREDEAIDGDFQTFVLRHGFVGESREDAWAKMRDGYLHLQRRYAEIFSGESVQALSAERKRILKERAVFGSPEQVVEELNAYRQALHEDVHLILRTYYPGMAPGQMATAIRRLGEDVQPALV